MNSVERARELFRAWGEGKKLQHRVCEQYAWSNWDAQGIPFINEINASDWRVRPVEQDEMAMLRDLLDDANHRADEAGNAHLREQARADKLDAEKALLHRELCATSARLSSVLAVHAGCSEWLRKHDRLEELLTKKQAEIDRLKEEADTERGTQASLYAEIERLAKSSQAWAETYSNEHAWADEAERMLRAIFSSGLRPGRSESIANLLGRRHG